MALRSELIAAGHGSHFLPLWHTLGYSDDEVAVLLAAKADQIRRNWTCSCEGDKRFANWMALRTALDRVQTVRCRRGGRVIA